MNFDLFAKLNIIYYKSVTFFKKIKIVHIFLCLYLKYMCFAGIPSFKTVDNGFGMQIPWCIYKKVLSFQCENGKKHCRIFLVFWGILGFPCHYEACFCR